ncbi:MAG TPA: GNAT family N-acetyltransferase [Pirellulaceae bacterium]|jgi:predicted N-acetyltransferase YhbS|nr:GNAT family N-acetyltransferase [Pirellulaceae bacterium]
MPPTESASGLAYALEPDLPVEQFIDVLVRSTLAERRPIDQPELLDQALRKASLIVTARDENGTLVGVSRALTDFSLATYLADLAVDASRQGRGIGRELIRRTHAAAGLHTMLILIAAPKARTYYPHIGMRPHDSCWIIERAEPSSQASGGA